jgi:hypothetical protein
MMSTVWSNACARCVYARGDTLSLSNGAVGRRGSHDALSVAAPFDHNSYSVHTCIVCVYDVTGGVLGLEYSACAVLCVCMCVCYAIHTCVCVSINTCSVTQGILYHFNVYTLPCTLAQVHT